MHFEYLKNIGLAAGHIADIGLGELESSGKRTPVIMKVARNSADDDLMAKEVSVLNQLRKGLEKSDWIYTIPQAFHVDRIQHEQETGRRTVSVLEFFPGFVTVADIRQAMTVDARTITWMWKRLLKLIDWVQHLKFVHGAILPPHVLYFPDNLGLRDQRTHAIRLVDWCYAVPVDSPLAAWVPEYADHYPPEIIRKKPVGAGTDIYMAAKLMLYLSGGDIRKNIFPDSTPKPMIDYFMKGLAYDIRNRPRPRVYFDEFVQIAEQCFGKPKFHEFIIPGIGGL